MGHFVVVKINENYRASVYDVADLERYMNSYPTEVNWNMLAVEVPAGRDKLHDVWMKEDAAYMAHYNAVVAFVQEAINARIASHSVRVERNQADRWASILTKHGSAYIVYYVMPAGAIYFNMISDMRNPNSRYSYKAVSIEWMKKNLTPDQLADLTLTLNDHAADLDDAADEHYNNRSKREHFEAKAADYRKQAASIML